MLPAVGSFYTRPKDTCSRVRCGSTDAVCHKQDRSGSVVCSMGCLAKRLKPRVMAEPTPLLFTKDATDAKQATFVFLYSRASTLFVPPPNLRQRQEVLDNLLSSTLLMFTLTTTASFFLELETSSWFPSSTSSWNLLTPVLCHIPKLRAAYQLTTG